LLREGVHGPSLGIYAVVVHGVDRHLFDETLVPEHSGIVEEFTRAFTGTQEDIAQFAHFKYLGF
jgi:hypothetical protein